MNNKELEPFGVDEDEMKVIVALTKAIKGYSKSKSVGEFLRELEFIELCSRNKEGHIEKILWHKPTLDVVVKIEKKFSNRLKELRKAGLIK